MNDSMVAQPVPDREQELDQLEAQVGTALERAAELGADGAEASASLQSGISVNVRLGEVETNFVTVGPAVKWLAIVGMLVGRLEVFTLLILFTPSYWRN